MLGSAASVSPREPPHRAGAGAPSSSQANTLPVTVKGKDRRAAAGNEPPSRLLPPEDRGGAALSPPGAARRGRGAGGPGAVLRERLKSTRFLVGVSVCQRPCSHCFVGLGSRPKRCFG